MCLFTGWSLMTDPRDARRLSRPRFFRDDSHGDDIVWLLWVACGAFLAGYFLTRLVHYASAF